MRPSTHLKKLGPPVVAALLLALSVPGVGLTRRLVANTIDPHATLSEQGSRIVVTGPVTCSQVEWVDMRVTVTQRSTGAVAEGRARLWGSTAEQHWTVEATTVGEAAFDEGPATAVALAVTTRRGETTDAHQWLVAIELEREP